MFSDFFCRFQKFYRSFVSANQKDDDYLSNFASFSSLFPYRAYDPKTKIFISENSFGFVLEALPLVAVDKAFEGALLQVLSELIDEGDSLQCLLWADNRVAPYLDSWSSSRDQSANHRLRPLFQKMAKQRVKHHLSRSDTRIFRVILSYSSPEKKFQRLEEIRKQIMEILASLSHCKVWTAQDLIEKLSALLGPEFSKDQKKKIWNEFELLNEQIKGSNKLQIEKEGLVWSNGQTLKTYRVSAYPKSWSLNGMQQLIGDFFRDSYRIDGVFLLHYGVYCPKQETVQSSNWMRMQFLENQGKSPMLCRIVPELEQELSDCDHVRRSLSQNERLLFTQLGFAVFSSREEMARKEQVLKGLLQLYDFALSENDCMHLPHFLSFLPMNWLHYSLDFKRLGFTKTCLSSEAATLFPLMGEWCGSSRPGLLLKGRRGQIFNWSPFENQSGNYNLMCVGRSGSGKSVFMQELLMTTLANGGRVFVIDVGRSFEKMSMMLQGQILHFSSKSNLCLNPFSLISNDPEEAESDLSLLKSVISSMVKPLEGTSDYENALIEKAIRQLIDDKQSNATITDLAQFLAQMEEPASKNLSVLLTPFTKHGVHSRFFEGENNVNFDNPMVLIELEELKEKKDLQSVVLQMVMILISHQAFLGDRKQPFHICIDEAWDLLRAKQTGVFIETLARRLRKYNGSLVIGTQSVDDFYATPGTLAAYENSDWLCLLSQKKSSIQRLAKSGRVDMDLSKQSVLESVHTRHGEYSEIMICDADGGYFLGRLDLDGFSNLLYSTKAEDYVRVNEKIEQGKDLVEAIEEVLQC